MWARRLTEAMPGRESRAQRGTLQREVYFPTYIYFKDLPTGEAAALNEDLKRHIQAWRGKDPRGIVRSNVKSTGAWHSEVDMETRSEFQTLCELILSSVAEVFRDLGYHSDWTPSIINMWANVSCKHAFNRSHVHPNSLWSGVYYVQAPERAGRIVFTEPRAQVRMASPVYERPSQERPESWDQVYFEPVEGRTIFFPSWLLHEVEPNMCETEGPPGDRISVSFNIAQRYQPPA